MSPYGTSAGTIGIKTTNNNSNTPPNVSFIGRRSTAEQLMDPFASSAPAVSLFGQYESSLLWRNSSPRTNMSSTDFIGLHSSPRESMDHHHHLFGSSSSSNNRPYLPTTTTARNNSHSYFSNNFSTSIPEHNQRSFINNDHGYDLNDAMLPSSLNDLFTPTELQARRLREQEHSTGNDWMIDNQQQQWRVPFLTRSSNEFYEDNKSTMTAAINIPGGNNNHEANILSSAYLQQDDIIPQQQDDEVQFFMEDDEVIPNNHKISGHD
ncbi:hypothetical protein G6F64_003536 [Rhizopus arrhizus]|uniref:Uncharacterized protein n=1 Tax=Rhizopus oryzae TaxID=64495 RepID=A0A9P6XEX7_RHIOR|nr:hypothetical protein G6F23_007603 [Rhizopus arrhizus]KAG1311807.1 hypothetical protein G6F64_003536 [Rhizopus arrhizus]